MPKRFYIILPALAIMVAAFLWAFDGVVLTPWINDLGLWDVPTFVLLLHLTASVFLSYFLITKRHELANLQRSDWIAFGLTALFGGAIGTMAIVAAIIQVHSEHLNIAVVLLLQKLQPIFAILLAYAWLKERPKRVFYFWAVLAIMGSYFLTFGWEAVSVSGQGMLIPALLAVLAAFSFGSSTVFSKKAITKVSHSIGTSLRFVLTTIIMFIIILMISLLNTAGISTGYAGIAGFDAVTLEMIGVFALIALTTGGTAIFIYYWGLKRIMASRATIFEMMFPLSAVVLEWLIHDQLLSAGQWFGAVIVILSITAIIRQRTAQQTPKTKPVR